MPMIRVIITLLILVVALPVFILMMVLGIVLSYIMHPKYFYFPMHLGCKAFLNLDPISYPEPKKQKPIPTIKVSTCIVKRKNKLLILQRPIDKMLGGLWEFPGGKIEKNESSENAVTREVFEETNLSIKNPKYIGEVKHQYSHFKVHISLFLTHIDNEAFVETLQEYQWVTRKELDSFALPKANYKMLEILDKLN